MNFKVISAVVIVILIVVIGGLVYAKTAGQDGNSGEVETTTTEETRGNLEELQKNENVADEVKALKTGMPKSEVQETLGTEPTESGEVNNNEYDSYERYDLGDGMRYDVYYNGDSLYGVSAVVQ